MKFIHSVLILATLAAALPTAQAWSCGPGGSSFGTGVFVRPDPMLMSPRDVRRRQQEFLNRAFSTSSNTRTSPRYEITDEDRQVKISLDVPGVPAEDIHVTIEDDVLSVSGQREFKSDGSGGSYQRRFSQSFRLDPTIDVEKFTANLKNGVLVITAPKDLQKIENNIRKIPIVDDDDDDATAAGTDDTTTTTSSGATSSGVVGMSSQEEMTVAEDDDDDKDITIAVESNSNDDAPPTTEDDDNEDNKQQDETKK